MTNEEQTDRDFISALLASSSQLFVTGNQSLFLSISAHNIKPSSTAFVIRTPSGVAEVSGVTFGPPT